MKEPPLISDLAGHAFFLDFDGTLIDIAARPGYAHVPAATTGAILRLRDRLCGALAIISGRDIASIDEYFSPHVLPVAGVHGLLRRSVDGQVYDRGGSRDFEDIRAEIRSMVGHAPGVLIETKQGAVAIHYREAPQAALVCQGAAFTIATRHPDLHVLEGKMVVELKSRSHDKGTAILAFMAEQPFSGRKPVFIGDDTTDEDGFRVVNALGGISVRVGAGNSAAAFRFPNTAAVVAWLTRLTVDAGRRHYE